MFKDILSAPNPATGVVLGVLIGEAIGQGPYQHYNLVELRQHSGPWTNVVSGINRVKSLPL